MNLLSQIPDILERIVERKRVELVDVRARLRDLEHRAETGVLHRRPFARMLRQSKPAIIAEIKRASPSRGVLADRFDPVTLARDYEAGGAAAVSVLTDRDFFSGSFADLEAARAAVRLPVLRKDFTIDEAHVIEAAAHGADAILLIAAILTTSEMRRLRDLAAQYLLAALVEVHDAEELERAIDSGAAIIGVNNRNLRTFEVRLETSLDLAGRMPAAVVKVSESGIASCQDVQRLTAAGYEAFLVGERLMRSENRVNELERLRCS